MAIGGRGQNQVGGVSEFCVKTLEEIRAEKERRRLQAMAEREEDEGANGGVCVCVHARNVCM